MNVFANGVPKCGNHALVKGLELLGVNATVNHVPFGEHAAEYDAIVFVKRDPRNALVSWLRFNNQPVTQGTFIAGLHNFDGSELVKTFDSYFPWLNCGSHVIAYEDLIRDDFALRELAGYLGVPYLEDAFANLPNHTKTWNAERSDYRTIWTPQVQIAWQDVGGNELLARWGY
jgi:hypothetical protein